MESHCPSIRGSRERISWHCAIFDFRFWILDWGVRLARSAKADYTALADGDTWSGDRLLETQRRSHQSRSAQVLNRAAVCGSPTSSNLARNCSIVIGGL